MTVFIKYNTSYNKINNTSLIDLSNHTIHHDFKKFKNIIDNYSTFVIIDFDNIRYFVDHHLENIIKFILSKDFIIQIILSNLNSSETISWNLKNKSQIYIKNFLSHFIPYKLNKNNEYKIKFKGTKFNFKIYYFCIFKTYPQINKIIKTNKKEQLHFYFECNNMSIQYYNFIKILNLSNSLVKKYKFFRS